MRAELRTTSYRPRRSSMILSGYMIEPAVLKGFRDSLPEEEIPKKRIIRILEDVFSSYGFVPIDRPPPTPLAVVVFSTTVQFTTIELSSA